MGRRSRGNRECMYEGFAMMKMTEYEVRKQRSVVVVCDMEVVFPCSRLKRNRLRSRGCLNDDFSEGKRLGGLDRRETITGHNSKKNFSGQGGHVSIWQPGLERYPRGKQ